MPPFPQFGRYSTILEFQVCLVLVARNLHHPGVTSHGHWFVPAYEPPRTL